MPGSTPFFGCLRITGKDRAKFLHNFCTNDVLSLGVGDLAEAFFCDVRARVLAHGWILAFQEEHCLLICGCEVTTIQDHLSRYVITEDVSFASPSVHAALFSPTTLPESLTQLIPANAKCGRNHDGSGIGFQLCWQQQNLIGVVQSQEFSPQELQQALTDAAAQSLRIAERIPIVGVDLSSDHLAPEAGRNETAISYQKGCYLGQEPIARIDAMGHVNRCLTHLKISGDGASQIQPGTEILNSAGAPVGVISSLTGESDAGVHGLAILRIADRDSELSVRTAGQITLTVSTTP